MLRPMAVLLSGPHLVGVIGTVVLAAVLVPAARLRPGPWVTVVCWVLGAFLIVQETAYEVVLLVSGTFSVRTSLPLFLCDVAAYVAGIALFLPRPGLVDLTWFWGIAGTLQGLITPDVDFPFPSWEWTQFYGDHGGVILAALLLVIGRRIHPRSGAPLRVFAVTAVFTAAVGVVDVVTGGNYMYLRRVPSEGSLLSLLGPWPWYIASATVLAALLLILLDVPFWPERRRGGHPPPDAVTKPFQPGSTELGGAGPDVR